MSTVQTPVPVVLAGARGHGRWHLANIRRLQDQGLVRLAGICELTPLTETELASFVGELPAQSADFGELLDSTGARVAVICTPIQTHTELALTAAARSVHLLLEKPPAATFADFERMVTGVRAAGIACQVGFQSFGSHAVPAIRALVDSGAIGAVQGIGAAGAWVRDDAYYHRAPWAGRRRIGTADVVDGVLTNPLAHAVATALELAGSGTADDVASIETELFRAHDIEADDTSCVRITTTRGLPVTASVTLCAEQAGEPYVIVHGDRGRITFWYKQDRVLIQRAGHGPEEAVHGRTDLLENLVDHLAGRAALLVPPQRTGAFMRVVEAVRTAPEPVALPSDAWHTEPATASTGARRVVRGIDALVAAGADTLTLFSELGVPWALPTEVSSS
ncbi:MULTISPECIES: Gfo/Idh/MocA family protein [unclassified Streptomyces]|uniref:Gfo/Idh/MocA family protein n=1 Tax=unclassified Streptomyces TaxID=2593676 RepID=UPI002DD7E747|nr:MULTISPECIES: Gfo/Idh/MocA family oxidoreductase [unclassified Streptomyces]WSF87463.1 Gfo/Idh/MocA family oxidoreductase [Streptomyces sp. NBC_01744]WSC36295.1 Gfo/Idh/MocA family oxidoreductase [Streptomyces sp. NBC_01763]WSC44394.1 Gfo/Idh/MocA family oxidoreductase [Streptomyces sp. NBC_01762]WSC56624.1 Gfo/Idh/MocA family oxidoreductase [Streptomyces sp. NBC_01761]WSD23981.1 Gfo/Idh/MocA family oxidoreductase [Streptomyces sp. NBC_01751]